MGDPNISYWDWRTYSHIGCGIIGIILGAIIIIPLFLLDIFLGLISNNRLD